MGQGKVESNISSVAEFNRQKRGGGGRGIHYDGMISWITGSGGEWVPMNSVGIIKGQKSNKVGMGKRRSLVKGW